MRVPARADERLFVSAEQFEGECVSFSTEAAQRVPGAYGMPLYVDDHKALKARIDAQDILMPCTAGACPKHETVGYEFGVDCAKCQAVVYCSEACRVADADVHGKARAPEASSECARAIERQHAASARGDVEF